MVGLAINNKRHWDTRTVAKWQAMGMVRKNVNFNWLCAICVWLSKTTNYSIDY